MMHIHEATSPSQEVIVGKKQFRLCSKANQDLEISRPARIPNRRPQGPRDAQGCTGGTVTIIASGNGQTPEINKSIMHPEARMAKD